MRRRNAQAEGRKIERMCWRDVVVMRLVRFEGMVPLQEWLRRAGRQLDGLE